MFVDFTYLNTVCPKDPYPLPNIDMLVDESLGYKFTSFTNTYSNYNKIKMDLLDAPKTSFMSNKYNY